ncbi:MAG: 23S rRNA (pseudouridine(1915)-N(3))-methyltransferase RlmH [Lachnospiraceae bacterium]
MNIRLIAFIKKPETNYRDIMKEYKKRLGRYASIQTVFCSKEKECEKYFSDTAYSIGIKTGHSTLTSIALSNKINEYAVNGISSIDFYIMEGMSGCLQDKIKEWMTISPLSMSPQVTCTIVLEQIYRAYRILNHEPYHK